MQIHSYRMDKSYKIEVDAVKKSNNLGTTKHGCRYGKIQRKGEKPS